MQQPTVVQQLLLCCVIPNATTPRPSVGASFLNEGEKVKPVFVAFSI